MKQRSIKEESAHLEARDEVSALARGLALLRVLADADGALSNRDLAERTGIPKATVSRLTSTLQSAGLVRAGSDDRFALGPGVLHLGNAYLRGFDLRQHARIHLAALAEAAGANVQVGVRDGLDMVLIDSVRPRTALILSRMDVGSRMAIATSAMGRAYLAALPAAEQSALRAELLAASRDAAATALRLDAARAEAQSQGFCTSFGEWHPDIHALGFSLRGPQGELYGVSVGGPAYKLPAELLVSQVGPRILLAREAIARDAGQA